MISTRTFEILGIVEDTRSTPSAGSAQAGRRARQCGARHRWRRHRLRRLQGGGLEPDAPLFFDRAVEVAGKTEQAQFRTVRIPKTHMPVVGFFVCEHLTPSRSIRAHGPGIPMARVASWA